MPIKGSSILRDRKEKVRRLGAGSGGKTRSPIADPAQGSGEKGENIYKLLFEATTQGAVVQDADGRVVEANQAACDILGLSRPQLLGQSASGPAWNFVRDDGSPMPREELPASIAMKKRKPISNVTVGVVVPGGKACRWILASSMPVFRDGRKKSYLTITSFTDITDSKKVEDELRKAEENYRSTFENAPFGIYQSTVDGRLIDVNTTLARMFGYDGPEEIMAETTDIARQFFIEPRQRKEIIAQALKTRAYVLHEVDYRRRNGETFTANLRIRAVRDDRGQTTYLEGTIEDISQRKQAEVTLARQAEELTRLYRASGSLLSSSPFDLKKLADTIIHVVLREFGPANGSVFLVQPGSNKLERIAVAGPFAELVSRMELTLDGRGLVPNAIRTGQSINARDVRTEPNYVVGWEDSRSELAIPLKIGERVIGVIDVQSAESGAFNADDERLMTIFSERAALALEHARLYAQTERRMQNLMSLRTIDTAISSSVNIDFTLGILLDQMIRQLGVHAADILIFNPHVQSLRLSAGHGFRTDSHRHIDIQLKNNLAGQVVRDRKTVILPDLTRHTDLAPMTDELVREGFVAYIGIPLVAKGQVKGVLEIFQQEHLQLDQDQNNFLEMLAGQAAIAIDSVQLFENLQSSNAELMMAYDETIEGWSHAMDLRDEETEGHSQRVTELTLKLAGRLGFGPEDLIHIRRGALLHDIGKIGVPDEVLNKTTALSEEEWVSMKKHPQFAHDMLAPITYLHSALDIPYCHHEKWDGTGYPRGLRGTQIPLAARIFAIVDVWDALTSDRPYRAAWTKEQALGYIREQAGSHFDPDLVDIFINEITSGG